MNLIYKYVEFYRGIYVGYLKNYPYICFVTKSYHKFDVLRCIPAKDNN